MKQVLCVAYVILLWHFASGLNFIGFEYLMREFNESISVGFNVDKESAKASWIEQPVNHFDDKDTRTWKMRYFERHDFWQPDKPIYFFLGGEGTASPVFLRTGIMYDLAKETGGVMYVAEHRYYGKSKPFEDFTTENLMYLSSRQALADMAKLLEQIKSSPEFKLSKVVVVGGSYAGNLAAWMRLLYPDLVDVAIASSAPVLAKADFYEYLETVSDDFEHYGTPGCWDKIAETFTRYETLFKSDEGITKLKDEENICDFCDMKELVNQQLFFLEKSSQFMYRAQYGSVKVIREYCESNFTSGFRTLKETDSIWNQKNQCYSYDFDDMITGIRSIDWYTAWIWQTCTEFGYYQTGSSDKHPFTRNMPAEFYYKMCSKLFGPEYDEARVEKGVLEVNSFYGGLRPNVTNVVFVNGDLDPWSKLGVLEDVSYEAPAKLISQASHCRDLFSDRDSDPEELKQARRYIRYLVKRWTGEGEFRLPKEKQNE